jgi:hypothetical protein
MPLDQAGFGWVFGKTCPADSSGTQCDPYVVAALREA